MPYYYHYTSKAGFDGIAGSCGASKTVGQYFEQAAEDGQWWPKESQPQKGSWWGDQHPLGFYMTELSPDDLQRTIEHSGS